MPPENEKAPEVLVLVLVMMPAALLLALVEKPLERYSDSDAEVCLYAPAIVSRMPMPGPMGQLTMTSFGDRLPVKCLITSARHISAWALVEDGSDYARIYAHAPAPESLIRRV